MPAADSGRPLVLVVEDNPVNLELIEAILDREGYHIVAAASAEEALERLRGMGTEGPWEVAGRRLKLTNLDKVYWPEDGYTKRDMIEHYVRLAPVLLPHLRDRPLGMQIFPDGIHGKHFWRKRLPDHAPAFRAPFRPSTRPRMPKTHATWRRIGETGVTTVNVLRAPEPPGRVPRNVRTTAGSVSSSPRDARRGFVRPGRLHS